MIPNLLAPHPFQKMFRRATPRTAGFSRLALAAMGVSLILPAQIQAAALIANGCIANTGSIECSGSGGTAPGLDGAAGVAVSPDGFNLYSASLNNDTVAVFLRGANGSLTSLGCIQNTGGTDCAGIGGTTPALNSPVDVAVSPDGENVYVVSRDSNALLTFVRNVDGTLTPAGCIQDQSSSALCAGTGGSTPGLRAPFAVAMSPDGANVYVASILSNAIATFVRNPNGSLTPAGCIQNTGGTDCAGSGGTAPGLEGAYDVAVSPDGENVYVASNAGDAIAIFDRGPAGALAAAGCIQDTGGFACTTTTPGLGAPRAVTVSPDGANVYVASADDNAIATFTRNADGSLIAVSCIENTGGASCAAKTAGLQVPSAVAVSPDGSSVYVASTTSDAIVAFTRDMVGSLAPAGCIQDTGLTACTNAGGSTTPGLNGAFDVTLSPGGTHVYVASFNDDAVVIFGREGFPPTSTTTTTTTTNTTTTTLPGATTTTLPATTTTTLPATTTTTLPVTTTTLEPTTTTTVEPVTTTTLEPVTTTTVEPPVTTTTLEPVTTTTLELVTTTTVEPVTTTTVEPVTTTTVEPVTTTTVEPVTTTTVEPVTTTTLPATTTTTTPDTTTTTTEQPIGLCGDWNNSGAVTSIDALAILKAAVGGDQCDAQPCICDVDGNGDILASDALTALRIAVGLPVATACDC